MPNKSLNLNRMGAVSISSSFIASSFDSGSYLYSPSVFSPGSSTWDIIAGFTTPSTYIPDQGIVTGVGSADAIHPFWLTKDGILSWGSSNGSSWNLWSAAIVKPRSQLQINTYYKMKCSFTGTSYTWSTWDDTNKEWVLDYTMNVSTPIYSGLSLCFGNNRGTGYPFSGTINLNDVEVYIGGELWLEGVSQKTITIDSQDYYFNLQNIGTPTLSSAGVASGFTAANYYITPAFNLDTSKSWYIEALIERTDDSIGYQMFFGNPGYYKSINFGVTQNTYYFGGWFYPTSSGSSFLSTTALALNTKTLVRGGYDKDNTCYYIAKVENGTETRLATYTSTSYRSTATENPLAIGMHFYEDNTYNPSYSQPFYGDIDLTTLKFHREGEEDWSAIEAMSPAPTPEPVPFTSPAIVIEQGGSCQSGVEYTFLQPFADNAYVLTIPYSSKTATSFVPSATGDFIAKGIGIKH